jgi:predicted YcjX-like family ATPase
MILKSFAYGLTKIIRTLIRKWISYLLFVEKLLAANQIKNILKSVINSLLNRNCKKIQIK